MVDVVGLYSGIRPIKGMKEPTVQSVHPGGNMFESYLNNYRDPAPGMYTPLEKIPSEFNPILQTKSLHGVLHCKGQPDAIRYGRFASSKYGGMYPNTPYGRHQPKGLAIDHNKSMSGPVMPIAGFYNPDQVNVLGNLKG